MGKMPTNSLGKSFELKLHCFCLFDAYSMPKDMCSVTPLDYWSQLSKLPQKKDGRGRSCRTHL